MTDILDCGHKPSPHSEHTTGYGYDPETGKRLCYECCTARDIAAMATERERCAYLSSDGKTITNWPGMELAKVTRLAERTVGFHRSKRTYIRAVDATGKRWHGTSPGPGMYVILKASRVS